MIQIYNLTFITQKEVVVHLKMITLSHLIHINISCINALSDDMIQRKAMPHVTSIRVTLMDVSYSWMFYEQKEIN